ncbi:MAG TPA: hypothetical protein VLL98_03590 [Rickettsiales bacterium]|nr:hypothetical protein [Rickettsiales bacterium]
MSEINKMRKDKKKRLGTVRLQSSLNLVSINYSMVVDFLLKDKKGALDSKAFKEKWFAVDKKGKQETGENLEQDCLYYCENFFLEGGGIEGFTPLFCEFLEGIQEGSSNLVTRLQCEVDKIIKNEARGLTTEEAGFVELTINFIKENSQSPKEKDGCVKIRENFRKDYLNSSKSSRVIKPDKKYDKGFDIKKFTPGKLNFNPILSEHSPIIHISSSKIPKLSPPPFSPRPQSTTPSNTPSSTSQPLLPTPSTTPSTSPSTPPTPPTTPPTSPSTPPTPSTTPPTSPSTPPTPKGIKDVIVIPQAGHIDLIVTSKISSFGNEKDIWPLDDSCKYCATIDLKLHEEYELLQKILKIKKTSKDNISDEDLMKLREINPSEYSDGVRSNTDSFVKRFEEINKQMKEGGIPCVMIVRSDSKNKETNLIENVKNIKVFTHKLNSNNSFRVRLNQEGLYLNLHLDENGNFRSCSFLSEIEAREKKRFDDNYISDGVSIDSFKDVLSNLTSFSVNNIDILEQIKVKDEIPNNLENNKLLKKIDFGKIR